MKPTSVLVLLLSCWMTCEAAQLGQCNLEGQWTNNLGSKMTISVLPNGKLFGAYLTAVSLSNPNIVESPLIGYQQLNGHPIFGFTVQWKFANSITVFTGQCYTDEAGKLSLRTMWLLRTESDGINDNWNQTRIGYNIFEKMPPKGPV